MTPDAQSHLSLELTSRLLRTREWARAGKSALYLGQRHSFRLAIELKARRLAWSVKRIPVVGSLAIVLVRAIRKLANTLAGANR
jgi:hypothetical protein